ncbi:putative uncharacterized protein [Clostridium sp. CAG:448]|nr:putative uncharacterized protein [Clostridium sp. CAG:448]
MKNNFFRVKNSDATQLSRAEYLALDENERKKWQPLNRRYEKLPCVCFVFYGLLAFAVILYVVALLSVPFSDFFNLYISSPIRMFLSYLTVWIPFSITEMIVILLPFLLVVLIVYALHYRCDTWKSVGIFVLELLSIVALLISLFVIGFGIGYRNSTVDKKLNLQREKVSAEELADTADLLVESINREMSEVLYHDGGFSVMPYTYREMNDKLIQAYDKFCENHDFLINFYSRVKPVMLSEAMSYTHITGLYAYYTGEANINVDFPDYTVPFTAAHELAHQRGIAREDEANFIAYLVCIGSDDPYIRYSGYLNMYEYVSSALYSADKAAYSKAAAALNAPVRDEMSAYSAFFEKYRNSTASKVSGTINNTYLQIQGTPGTKSYGLVVDLAVAYHKETPAK